MPPEDPAPSSLSRKRVYPLQAGTQHYTCAEKRKYLCLFSRTVPNWQAGSNHVRIADGFDLVHVIAFDASIEQLVDRVQERDNLQVRDGFRL